MESMARVLGKCVLCDREMHGSTKPWYIIDPKTGEVRGKAHSTCRYKISDGARLFTVVAAKYSENPPSAEKIQFALMCGPLITEQRESRSRLSLYKTILLDEAMFKISNLEELFSMKRVQELLEWWVNGSKIISADDREAIKDYLKENLTNRSKK